MKRVIVSVINDLSTDQRVDKVCSSLHNAGYDVLLIGRIFKDSLPHQKEFSIKRIKLIFNKGFLFYAEYNFRLFFILFYLEKDILVSNDIDTLLANFFITKIQRKKLVFDSHELFSEIPELINKPFIKNIWLTIERWILPKLKNNYTVCESIANFYKKEYNSNFKIIKNLPLKKETQTSTFPFKVSNKKIILYQGSINIGRGLELMIETIQFLPNCIFVLVGFGDILEDLKRKVLNRNISNKVKFLGRLTPEELHKITPLASIGVSLEEDLGLNYRYALPNKIFDYIQAEIPILVSNLPEMKRVILDYNVGEIIYNREPKELAKQIEKMLEKKFSESLTKAREELIWEHQEEELLSIYKNL